MTAIVALEHEGKVWMGCDSAAIATGSYDLMLRHVNDPKIIAFPEHDLIIGCSGMNRLVSLIADKFIPPDDEETADQPKRVYACAVRDALRELFEGQGGIENDKPSTVDGYCLIGYQGVVWEMDSQFALTQPADAFAAIGCGNAFALGAMYGLRHAPEPYEAMDPEYMIEAALEAAERFSAGVRGPFVIKAV
jgi:ATP-dependent protease HslVU (ClpYQ) peptidase subunit